MKKIKKIMFVCIWAQVFGVTLVLANETADHSSHLPADTSQSISHQHSQATSPPIFSLKATPKAPLKQGSPANVTVFLKNETTQQPVTENQLKRVHTQKVHALIIDPTLADYHHVHPKPGNQPGEYTFTFTPATSNAYRVWLDITPTNSDQQYVIADLPGKNMENPAVKKVLATESQVGDYHFTLAFNKKQLKTGEAATGSVVVKDKNGLPVTTLEPIMEAFAHIVAFNQDYHSILHVHPMGEEPKQPDLRGGPRVDFHITPTAPGYVKLFAQVQIEGKEYIAPFGINVE